MTFLDILAYILLLLGFGVGSLVFYRLRNVGQEQFLVIIFLVGFYLVWGIIFHSLKKDLDRKLLLEYLVIAAIAAVAGVLVFVS